MSPCPPSGSGEKTKLGDQVAVKGIVSDRPLRPPRGGSRRGSTVEDAGKLGEGDGLHLVQGVYRERHQLGPRQVDPPIEMFVQGRRQFITFNAGLGPLRE